MEETLQNESFSDWVSRVATELNKAAARGVEILRPYFDAIVEFCKKLNTIVYQWYLSQGAKYGETSEGCQRWLEELVAENQRKQEAEARAMLGNQEEVPLEDLLIMKAKLGRRLNLRE